MKVEEGLPHPLGATRDGRGTDFALFLAGATIFDVAGTSEVTGRSFVAFILEGAKPTS